MNYVTVISRKTPKTRRPVDKKVYTIKSSLRATPFRLEKNKNFTIGRATKNSMALRSGTVSERHAVVKWDKSSFKITDARSTNGTFVNGRRIKGTTILKSGDKIKIGQFVLTFGVKKVREKPETPKKKPARKKARARKGKRSPARKTTRARVKRPVRRTVRRSQARRKPARRAARPSIRRDMALTRIRF